MRFIKYLSLITAVVMILGCEEDRRGTGGGNSINNNDTTGTGNGNGNGNGTLDLKEDILGTWNLTRFDKLNRHSTSPIGSSSGEMIAVNLQSSWKFMIPGSTISNDSLVEMINSYDALTNSIDPLTGDVIQDTIHYDEHLIGDFYVVDDSKMVIKRMQNYVWEMDVQSFTADKLELFGYVEERPTSGVLVTYELYITLER